MDSGIRRALISDIDEMLPLIEAYWRFERIAGFDATAVQEKLRQLFTNPKLGLGLIHRDSNGTLVAYLLGVFVFSLENLGITSEIDEFFVAEAHRSSGIGKAMLEAAEIEFVHAGSTCVSLQVSRDNDAARRFYEHRGYIRRTIFELMEKDLSAA
ncbi:MAG: GNAT family N-acetyltransferase [Gammaproteobacteria bacterium]|nr:GNAT family N-acetyltransferase [Gammaproteobacteria bacterium]